MIVSARCAGREPCSALGRYFALSDRDYGLYILRYTG